MVQADSLSVLVILSKQEDSRQTGGKKSEEVKNRSALYRMQWLYIKVAPFVPKVNQHNTTDRVHESNRLPEPGKLLPLLRLTPAYNPAKPFVFYILCFQVWSTPCFFVLCLAVFELLPLHSQANVRPTGASTNYGTIGIAKLKTTCCQKL